MPDLPLPATDGRSVSLARLSGRAIQVPDAGELVALGAAAQAAAALHGETPDAVATRWNGATGTLLDPVPVDRERLDRIRELLADVTADEGRR